MRILALLVLGFSLVEAAPVDRPNILFLLSDDQRADAVGIAGSGPLHTPSLDSLARRGIRFTNAYYMGSPHAAVCAPSRAMLLSGRSLAHVTDDLAGIPTLPQLLREAGYITFGTGKWHNGEASFAAAFTRGRDIFFGGMSDHSRVPVCDLQANGTYTEAEPKGFSSTVFARAAIEFLQSYAAGDQRAPFFAYVAFTAPHDPRMPPEGYARMYQPERLALPGDYLPVHPFDNGWMTGRDEQLAPWPRTPEVIRAQLSEYYGMISHLDHEIGRILESLAVLGLRERTIVVFASDNGLSLGSHGLMGKQNLYEHSIKIPLILSGRGVPTGEHTPALVYLHDLAPTLLELLGMPVPVEMDGLSLVGIVTGSASEVRSSIFTSFGVVQRAVRTGRWKLIRYPRVQYTQLFDLTRDPLELENLAELPAYREDLRSMMELLRRSQREEGDTLSLTSAVRAPMEFDPSTITRTPDRHQPEEIVKKYFPPSR